MYIAPAASVLRAAPYVHSITGPGKVSERMQRSEAQGARVAEACPVAAIAARLRASHPAFSSMYIALSRVRGYGIMEERGPYGECRERRAAARASGG